jgi:hypothetical protein
MNQYYKSVLENYSDIPYADLHAYKTTRLTEWLGKHPPADKYARQQEQPIFNSLPLPVHSHQHWRRCRCRRALARGAHWQAKVHSGAVQDSPRQKAHGGQQQWAPRPSNLVGVTHKNTSFLEQASLRAHKVSVATLICASTVNFSSIISVPDKYLIYPMIYLMEHAYIEHPQEHLQVLCIDIGMSSWVDETWHVLLGRYDLAKVRIIKSSRTEGEFGHAAAKLPPYSAGWRRSQAVRVQHIVRTSWRAGVAVHIIIIASRA